MSHPKISGHPPLSTGLFSWATMKDDAATFLAIEQALTKRLAWEKLNKQRTRSMEERLSIQRVLVEDILPLCNACGLRVSAGFIADISKQFSDQSLRMKSPEIMSKLDSVQTLISSEINQRIFLQIPANREAYYTQVEPLFGESVADAFPSAAYDIAEAGKCLALERGTTCVFHLLRAMDACRLSLIAALKLKTTKTTWAYLLNKLPNNPATLRAHALFKHCQHTLRNPALHMEKTYTPEDAVAIFEAVKAFMQWVSTLKSYALRPNQT